MLYNLNPNCKIIGDNRDSHEWRSVKPISVILVIFGGLLLQLTKLLIKAVLALFYGKKGILHFIRTLLPMREQHSGQPPIVSFPHSFRSLMFPRPEILPMYSLF